MLYTLRINISGAAVLDGSTFVGPADSGVLVTNPNPGIIQADVSGIAFGMIDPGDFLERGAALQGVAGTGNTYTLVTASAVSSGGAYPGPGSDLLERVSPAAGANRNRETIHDFSNGATSMNSRKLFLPGHHLAVTTTVAGPHLLTLLFKPLTDADLRNSIVE